MKILQSPTLKDLHDMYEPGRKEYFGTIGVVKTSGHLLKSGILESYYLDFDIATSEVSQTDRIIKQYVGEVDKIRSKQSVDYLGFIEKCEGTVGAIKLSSSISLMTGIPVMIIRPHKDIEFERIKIPPKQHKKVGHQLDELTVVLITDHCTTGKEVLKCANIVKENGGVVTDLITYTSREDKIKDNLKEFKDKNINFRYIYQSPKNLEEVLALKSIKE